MPRPAASALRRATASSAPAAATTSAAAPCTCSCRPAAPTQQRHASTHAITASTSSAAAAPFPVVETVHAGGFGFFSRSLPKRKPQRPSVPLSTPSSSTQTTTLQSTSAWILHAPPQFPVDLPIPSALVYTLSAPPPPPPAPQTLPFDVRNWSPTPATRSSTTRATSPVPIPPSAQSTPTTLIGAGGGARAKASGSSRCVCGRAARTGCMRCRASSTASLAMRTQSRLAAAGSGYELALEEDGPLQDSLEEGAEGEERRPVQGKKGPQRRRREPNGPPGSPSARLAELLHQYSPKSLPHFRGVSVVASQQSPSRHSSRTLSLAEAHEALSAIQQAVSSDESFLAGLSVHEKLDLVRAVSTIARAVQPFPPLELLPSSSSSSPGSSSSSPDETKRIRLRHHASELMRDLLKRAGVDRIDTVGDSPQSGTRSSAALLVVDATCLADDVVALSDSINIASMSPPPLAAAVTNLFRQPVSSVPGRSDKIASSRQRNRAQNAHAALALVLEALDRSPHSDASDTYSSALVALRLMHDLGAAHLLDFVQPDSPPPSREKQTAYNDVLRRKYGVILARLEPTPSRWFARQLEQGTTTSAGEDSEEDALAAVGLHLIRHLARAGSAGEAFAVWQKVAVSERREGKSLRSRLTDLERLEALTSLVDGLAMDRLFADGNTLAIELEELARAVQIGGDHEGIGGEAAAAASDAPTAAAEPFVGEPHPRVPEAYRALARLAANQGRAPILDRLLARLAAVTTDSDSSVLEPAARQMRARSRRYELDEVRAIFDSAELAAASPEERARLWGQLIAAHVRVNDVEGGLRTLQEMLETGLYVPLVTINVILHGFARRGDVKRSAELFARIAEGEFPRVQPDTGSWNALILAHVVARDPSTAEALIKEMRLSGARPDKQTWTTLLSAYVENGQWTAAFRIYRHLQSHPDPTFRPDTAVYNVMLKACILTGTPAPTVVELFRDLVARSVRPNMRTYTLVLQSVCLAGMMDVAEELFLLMDRRHDSPNRIPGMSVIEPDQFVFATLVTGYLRRGQSDKARAMLLEMNARGIRTSSIAVGIIIAARVAALQEREGHISAESMQRVIQQARDFLRDGANGEPGGLAARRRRQPVRFDRPLALGKEAAVVYSPILRSLAKQGDIEAALELFDEILDRQDARDSPPVELYTTLMDGFRIQAAELDSPAEAEEMAQSVYSIWHQLYDSVCKRFVRLRPLQNVGEAAATVGGPPLPKFARRIDPAQAGLLRLPLTILLDTATHLDDRSFIEATWRRLAQQGFAFDISNWNALAAWFIRDLQLEKALWITEHVLCRPADDEEADVQSFAKFASELAAVDRLDAVGRAPTRLWQNRQTEAPRSVDLSFLDEELASSPRDDEPGVDAPREGDEAEGTEPPSATSGDDLQAAFQTAHSRSVALTTLAYRRTLEFLGAALDHLTVNGTVRPEEDAEIPIIADTAGPTAASGSSSLDEAQTLYRRLVRDHPRTIRAIETLRAHRQRAEMDRYERSKGRY